MKCLVGLPLINASKKSLREARSTTGVPVIPGRIKTSARGGWDGRTNISARPDREARRGIKRINIVRFSNRNDHRPIRTALDVKRLSVNGAGDRAVEVEIARQVGGS